MSQKNSREAKKRRRVLKALRKSPDAHIDLIHYVKVRTNCTTGMARKVLLAGALMVDSHPVGYQWEKGNAGNVVKVLYPWLPAEMRERIVVVKPNNLNIEKLGLK